MSSWWGKGMQQGFCLTIKTHIFSKIQLKLQFLLGLGYDEKYLHLTSPFISILGPKFNNITFPYTK